MYYYKTTLRLGGNTMNEVVKIVSAPEFLVLQFIHGPDALTKVEVARQERVKMHEEKQRIKAIYDNALVKREQSIDSIFGALGQLPDVLPEEILERHNIFEYEVDTDDIVKLARKRSTEPTVRMNEPKNEIEYDRQERILPTEEVNVADLME